ncbi:hypothetical protein ASPZODRAFT_147608 [Penicilliopsis zonata CBS 506.65]|uniref:Uncharacterized protein n=1 Tax=Penicilliopsis zonata CBS 506.65 TaxID=1073090 RepID=A0A1L9S561_9EURO|nr:hypothetical protein ASPZODRAFT_147608 [Penicilliopsis zonata CBS 506.65]OJJ42305.1 hypothetical protein ASPZODRAFT_147608 [Penicilliopsis zonata CBS 506.65]
MASVTGRWINTIAMEINKVTELLDLPQFTDYQTGKDNPIGCSINAYPDIILVKRGITTVLVGEFKTPWSTDLSDINGNTGFQSPALYHTQGSLPARGNAPPRISVIEALLYMAYLGGGGQRDAYYHGPKKLYASTTLVLTLTLLTGYAAANVSIPGLPGNRGTDDMAHSISCQEMTTQMFDCRPIVK